jgi:DNA-binding SARP family transcriptional activator
VGAYTIRLFGGFAVEQPSGAAAPALPQRRAEAMLAILAVCGSLGSSRERLMALLWPESDEAHGRHHLRDALYAIRRAYGSTAVLTEGDIVRLAPATLRSDVQEFAVALAEGRPADAVAVYGGAFLDGFHVAGSAELERWIEDERARLFREYQLAIKGLAKKAETGARWDAAAEWWGRLLTADPYNSRAAVRRMVALARSGDRANAIREGEAHCRRLKVELELDPDPELLEELERIRGGAVEPSYFSGPGDAAPSGAPGDGGTPGVPGLPSA